MLKLPDLPVDLLFLIATDLDAASVTRLLATCKKLRKLLQSFSNLIFKNIAKRDFKILKMPTNIRSYHQLVLTHESLRRRICYPADDDGPLKTPTHYLMAWPVHESSAYMVALSGHFLIWVDIENMKKMYIKDLQRQNWDQDDLIMRDYTLRGHTSRIGLILANNDGLLVSFDISCDIFVWDINEKKLERKINTREELGMIMSMNLYKNFVVCAGINGKIAVWDAHTGLLTHSFTIPDRYLGILEECQLNVSICGDLVAFGLSDGKFYIYSLSQEKFTMEFDVMKQISNRMRRRNQNMISDIGMNFVPEPAQQAPQDLNVLGMPEREGLMERDLPMNLETPRDALENVANIYHAETDIQDIPDENVELENNSDNDSEDTDVLHFLDRFPVDDTSVPLTLSLSSHFLLTNGPDPSCLALWDVQDGKFIGFLDDTCTSRKTDRSTLAPLRFAEVSVDGSMIYSVSGDLMVWNFMDLNHPESKGIRRYFVEGKLDLGDDVWIGFETHEKL